MSNSARLDGEKVCLPIDCGTWCSPTAHNSYSCIEFDKVIKQINYYKVIASSDGLNCPDLLWSLKPHYSLQQPIIRNYPRLYTNPSHI
jgi:hypothetical protein